MRQLILIRHAKSDWDNPQLDDHDRPLNKRGRNASAALGKWLNERNHVPDEILCSTAERCRETLTGLREGLPEADTRFEKALYHAAPMGMMEKLKTAKGKVVMMLGHNPGIAAFAAELADRVPTHGRFADYPTGAATLYDFPIDDWADLRPQSGRVVDFVIPEELP